MDNDLSTIHWFWTETMNRLESLRRRVREARDLMEAADFGRYVLNSQMGKILALYDNQGLLKVDSAALGLSAADLLRDVQELWRTNQVAPEYNVAQFDAILHRLDLIAGQLARVPTSGRDSAAEKPFVPQLIVLPGGGGGEL
jgi:hypothetical protein